MRFFLQGQSPNRRTTTIGNLYSNIVYEIRVRAANLKGVGEASAPSRGILTAPKAPTKMVTSVTGGGGKQVKWCPRIGLPTWRPPQRQLKAFLAFFRVLWSLNGNPCHFTREMAMAFITYFGGMPRRTPSLLTRMSMIPSLFLTQQWCSIQYRCPWSGSTSPMKSPCKL